MSAIAICMNGEPSPDLWRYFGPFEGVAHARLWLDKVHCIHDEGLCGNAGLWPAQHYVESLEPAGHRQRTRLQAAEMPQDAPE